MELAASNIAWNAADDAAAAGILLSSGASGVEIAPTQWRPDALTATTADIKAYRSWWNARGLRVVALQALLFGRPDLQLFGDAQARLAFTRHLRNVVEFGARIGAHALVFGSPRNRWRGALSSDEAMTIAAEVFAEIGAAAADAGVVVCIEPNPAEYGCDFVTTTAEAVELCLRSGSPAIRVQVDVGAMTLAGEDYLTSLHLARPLIGHVHVSEPRLVEPGSGGADHRRAADALKTVGYSGCVSVEMRAVGLDAFARALRHARTQYGIGSREDGESRPLHRLR